MMYSAANPRVLRLWPIDHVSLILCSCCYHTVAVSAVAMLLTTKSYPYCSSKQFLKPMLMPAAATNATITGAVQYGTAVTRRNTRLCAAAEASSASVDLWFGRVGI